MNTSVNQLLRKYFIMGSQNCNCDPAKILEEAALIGITAFQFREKGEHSLSGNEKIKLGLKLRDICRKHHIPFFINDDVELAETLDVDGIHVGQEDQPVEQLRRDFPDKIIGLSVSNTNEVEESPIHLVDYVGAGPIFPTSTKEDAKEAVGLEWIQTLRSRYPKLPIVGIGGINTENAASVLEAGADGVSVISAITRAQNISDSIIKL
ncbi:thiamine phosphate synthase [Oceanobacillus halophilus]|uniref:Thiamine-phosphate synthase n=1 Tax=Oceanobacillus halophilus TaxID=930130 RepID=A0A495A4M2_9BACI|nr:thiamine phosphate synthase [Oceanobacillus halophilus]RKQ33247.1 thiamine phosphate synthase [Oceanobacillus halophilus]